MALAPELPLHIDDIYGAYGLITKFDQLIKQNLTMLVLTAPGERIMDPKFGVGLRNFLFENKGPNLVSELKSRIFNQVKAYMPFVNINFIDVMDSETTNLLVVAINYEITSLGIIDETVVSARL